MAAPLRRRPLSEPSSETARPSGPRVARNTLHSAAAELSNLPLFVLGFLAARLLAPEAFGQYSAAFAFVGLFRLLPDLGMSYASTIAISRDRTLARSLIGNLLGFQVVLSALTLALCLWLGSLLFEDVTWIAVVVLSIDLVLKGVQFTLRWLLKSFEMFGTEAIALVIERVLILGAGLAALITGQGVVGFVLAFAIVRFLAATSLFAYVYKRVLALHLRWELAVWADLLVKGAPFAYAGAVILMFFQIDAIMLEQMRGAREVGLYSAPVRVLEGLTLIPRVLAYALIPTMAALFTHDPAAVTRLYNHGLRYLLIVGLPIATFGALASEPFMVMLFGADYAPSAAASRILLPAAIFMFLSNFAETTLACVNRWRTIVVVSTVALVINISLNLIWIPRYGFPGAAWATLATESAYLLMSAGALQRGHAVNWLRLVARPLIATAVFGITLWSLLDFNLGLASVAASAAYVVAVVSLGLWSRTEWETLRALAGKREASP